MNRNKLTRAYRALFLSLCLPVSTGAVALPEDRDKQIQIEADRAIRNEKEGTTVYIGNVELVQGTLLMQADRLEIYNDENNDVIRVIGYGKPAYVEDQPTAGKPPIKARANTIRYFVIEEKLDLEKNASIEQDGSIVESDTIVYLVKDEVVEADSNNQTGRVKMVIPPRTDKKKP